MCGWRQGQAGSPGVPLCPASGGDRPGQRGPLCPSSPQPFTPGNQGGLSCTPSHTNAISSSAASTAGFLVFKPELISRLEQGQEPWVLDLQGAEGREAARTSKAGEASGHRVRGLRAGGWRQTPGATHVGLLGCLGMPWGGPGSLDSWWGSLRRD